MELIGRERELEAIRDRVASRRLVTIIGPGGIGKTALAKAAIERERSRFELGTRFVDLSRVESAEAVGGALAGQLGFPSVEALLNSPAEQPVLLLVDNCEHVTDAAAAAIAALLDACAAPTVLATSRSPLDVPGESLVALGPLAIPDGGESATDAAAVRLFLERARDAGVEPTADDLAAVVELCRQLDGLPLAIELAAARARYMTPTELVERLAAGTDVLARPHARGRGRHRSLHDTIEWSYRLLDDDARRLFERVGACAASFPTELAVAVASDHAAPAATHAAIERLVDASLLLVERGAGGVRYRMLETIRAFAVQRLTEAGALDETHDRLVDHVCDRARAMIDEATRDWQVDGVRQLVDLHDNVAAAVRWCLAHDPDESRAFVLCAALWGVVHQANVDEVAELTRAVLDRWPGFDRPLAGDVAATLATALFLLGRPEEAATLAEAALAGRGPTVLAPITLRRAIALSVRARGDSARAVELFGAAAEHAMDLDEIPMALQADAFRAQTLADLGRLDEASALVGATLAAASAAGSTINEIWARSVEGYVVVQRDPAAAIPVIERALAASRQVPFPFGICGNLRTLSLAHLACDEASRAAAALLEMLDEQSAGGVWDPSGPLAPAALVLRRCGHPAWRDVAASVRGVPVCNPMAGGGIDLGELPRDGGRALAWREALTVTRQALQSIVEGHGAVADTAPAPGRVAALRRDGDTWAVTFDGSTVRVKPTKGVDDLARLLAAPGTDVHCLELIESAVVEHDAGDVIDSSARRQYEQRIRDLQEEIDEATDNNDPLRAEKANVELDALVEHLTAAVGLGGRTRRASGSAERARSAVTHRLRATIRHIGELHPVLGRHLRASISSGTYCTYRPDPHVDWVLER